MSRFVNGAKSPALIMSRMRNRQPSPTGWHKADDILKPLTKHGPFSEDLETLVEEGKIKAFSTAPLGPNSWIKLG